MNGIRVVAPKRTVQHVATLIRNNKVGEFCKSQLCGILKFNKNRGFKFLTVVSRISFSSAYALCKLQTVSRSL